MEVLKIEWFGRTKGQMNLVVDKFFPCTQEKGKIVFPLIRQWCSEETISELAQIFETKVAELEATLKPLANKATSFSAKSKECKAYTAEFKHNKTLIQRYKKNIMMLKGSEK